MIRADRMKRADVLAVQQRLNALGFGPLTEDGVWGAKTADAYEAYLGTVNAGPAVAPAPAKPWWTSRRAVGGAMALAFGLFGLTQYGLNADQLTDVALQLAELIALLVTVWGGIRAKRPIDPTLVMPGVRWPARRVQREPVPSPDSSRRSNEFWTDQFPLNGQ